MYKKASAHLIRSLKLYKANLPRGHLQRLATEVGVDQSQVSRILSGEFKTITPPVIRICKYANIFAQEKVEKDKSCLIEAIDEVWDGSDEIEELLLNLIRSVQSITVRSQN